MIYLNLVNRFGGILSQALELWSTLLRTLSILDVLALWGSGPVRHSGDIRAFRIHQALSVRETQIFWSRGWER